MYLLELVKVGKNIQVASICEFSISNCRDCNYCFSPNFDFHNNQHVHEIKRERERGQDHPGCDVTSLTSVK